MSLNIKSAETHELAAQLARLTGAEVAFIHVNEPELVNPADSARGDCGVSSF